VDHVATSGVQDVELQAGRKGRLRAALLACGSCTQALPYFLAMHAAHALHSLLPLLPLPCEAKLLAEAQGGR